MVDIQEQYCIVDIETFTPTGKPDPEQDILRYVGFKMFNGKKIIYHVSQREEIQKVISYFPYLVGHNIIAYDMVVLSRHGFGFPKKQVLIDTLKISVNRLKSMLYLDLGKGELSLRKLGERFNLPSQKEEMDYSILTKEVLEGEEYKQLEQYLNSDLDTGDELFKYFYNLFYGFKQYMSPENQLKMKWLINRPGSTAYACICNLTGMPEEYNDVEETVDSLYTGGYVSEPYGDYFE